ncbi:hypothetical protein F4861DRAFT_491781 [Xylaria intraflava]|nr:hypothetical protein F4861DRAFT_491781 [Xylaria intraflava]
MGGSDVDTLLQNGYWSNSRAKSLESRNIYNTPHRSNYPPQDDRATPRTMVNSLYTQKPPPPSVEDEYDALAKEAGSVVSSVPSEEPSNRGDPDQYPILVPVQEPYEQNPERRFVLLSNPSGSSTDPPAHEEKRSQRRGSVERSAESEPDPASYEANTGRKYGSSPSSEDKTTIKKETRPEHEPRRSRLEDLPPIITDDGDEGRSHDTRRAKSTTGAERHSDDYFPPRLSSTGSRYPRENLTTPEVIEHATNGRERPYYRGGSSPVSRSRNRSARRSDAYGRDSANDRRYKERGSLSARSPSPTLHRRHKSENPKYTRHGSKESYESRRLFADAPSSKSDRKAPSPIYSQSDRDSGSQHSPTGRERMPTQHSDSFYSSEDESRSRIDHYRRSVRSGGKTEYLNTPVESRGTGRRKSRGRSPLASPQLSQYPLTDSYSSASSSRSATFPREARSPIRTERSRPRASTGASFTAPRNANPLAGALTAPMVSASSPSSSGDPRRSTVLQQPRASSIMDTRMQLPPPSTVISTQSVWTPQFDPPPTRASSNSPVSSYGQYSSEEKNGELPDIPPCPRTREETGHMDWLTLPRCDNFNICPSCYSANFASTEFAHHFVPAPFRPQDRPLACDFGTSEFYRIAWLFTRKYGRADLGLFHGLARTTAQIQPCTGSRPVSRIWYSIKDPRTRRPMDEFPVCAACAKAVETLLPSLTGMFVPLKTPPEPARGVCAMSQDGGRYYGRFSLYFGLLEGAADRAHETQSAPNVQALADRVGQLTAIPPCAKGNMLRNAYWHTMRSVPGFAVCPECFAVVVRPLLDGHEDLTVAGNFHHVPTHLPEGECMLFSDRMRDVFDRAVRKRDLLYLDTKVGERIDKERECNARLDALRRQGLDTPWAKTETGRILQEWKRYE